MDQKQRTPLYRAEDGVAWLTLNRPETLNSFTQDFVLEIDDAIQKADTDSAVRVLVVTGEGRGFTSGGNLSELAEMNRDRQRAIYDVDSTADMVRLLYNVKKPVIAAINGPAFGAGIAMAMACDILIASEKAQFGYSFTGLGFCPDSGATWFLTQKVGYNKACEILFSAKTLKAEELLNLGLVNRVVGAEELLPVTEQIARRIAAGPSLALMLQKRVLRNAVTTTFEQNRDYEAVSQIFASQTDDCAEGLAAALERRKPNFRGK
ncbi:MAG: enoyl-CoA hydratase/isomerase family protein [Oscillospiraceae bacterium]|nr:enoyl-CoA hydratase/isomerase family protein [Oscillospiraceae bacterium]